jgi:hypothetical protein
MLIFNDIVFDKKPETLRKGLPYKLIKYYRLAS